ncbi:tachylectin-related carbohydrate-binding protein [Lentzea sp. CA-135723]|uniref:tachylectin-related carbohydrate-binding protein n=1 Tax=Lentzea sp. CA-135723 TaxID=3239950 RepID=UPI003D8EE7B1
MFRSGGRWRAVVLTVAVSAGIIVPAQSAQAVNWISAAAFASCVTDVPVFAARDNGELWLHPHQGTRSGKATWGQARQIGSGWTGRALAGPNGQVLHVETGGALKRFAWNGTGWTDGAGSVLAQGWQRFATTARDLVTVDSAGDIYRVDADGSLRRFAHDGTRWVVDGQELAKGWDRYNLIVAAGPGVLYARTPSGELTRHHYADGTWLQRDTVVGQGWQRFRSVGSAGGDTLFGIDGDQLWWHRFVPALGEWVSTQFGDTMLSTSMGAGWSSTRDIAPQTTGCSSLNPLEKVHRIASVGASVLLTERGLRELRVALQQSVGPDAPIANALVAAAKFVQENQAKVAPLVAKYAANPHPLEDADKQALKSVLDAAMAPGGPMAALWEIVRRELGTHVTFAQAVDLAKAVLGWTVEITRMTVDFAKTTKQLLDDVPGILDQMLQGYAKMNEGLTEVNVVVDQSTKTLGQLNAAMEQMNSGLDVMNNAIVGINSALNDMNAAITSMNAAVTRMNRAVDALNNGGYDFFRSYRVKFDDLDLSGLDRIWGQRASAEELAKADRWFSLAVDFVPFAGDAKGIWGAVSGRDPLTGEELSGADRAMGSLFFLRYLKNIRKGGDLIYTGSKLEEAKRGRALVENGKYDYLFGKVDSNSHNAARSRQNKEQLARIGVHDTPQGRALIKNHLDQAVTNDANVQRVFTTEHGTFQIRDSLFAGPGGFLHFESTWHVTQDGLRLTTIIPKE